jgi:hypothetical protein
MHTGMYRHNEDDWLRHKLAQFYQNISTTVFFLDCRFIVWMLALVRLVRCIILLRPDVGAPRIMAGCTPPAIAQNTELAW